MLWKHLAAAAVGRPTGNDTMPPAPRSNPAPRVASVLLAALAMLPAAAAATMIVPMGDAQLADSTRLIVEVRVLAVEPAPGPRPAIDYLVQVERLIVTVNAAC